MADAGRVIAGTARGIRLQAPGPGTRPLADRVKQTLFAILEPDLRGARVLDLFAGSGAAGIEALSRGAASATFVEHDAGAARVIGSNGFGMTPSAPSDRKWSSSLLRARAVMNTTGICAVCRSARSRARVVGPSICGIITSIRIRSGGQF